MRRELLLALVAGLACLAGLGAAEAHVEVGLDLDHDGDCQDAGEAVLFVPTLGLHHEHACA